MLEEVRLKMATSNINFITEVLEKFKTLTKNPENYLGVQNKLADEIKCLTKQLYDYTKSVESDQHHSDALPELIIHDFDDEQIWQELELQNNGIYNALLSNVALLVARKDRLCFPVQFKSDEVSNDSKDSDTEIEGESDRSDNISDTDKDSKFDNNSSQISTQKTVTQGQKRKQGKPSIVDDQFFKLDDFEKLDKLENRQQKSKVLKDSDDSDDESVDWFGEDGNESDEEKEGEHYSEFYDAPDRDLGEQIVERNAENSDDDDEEEEEENEEEREEENLDDQRRENGGTKRVKFNLLDDNENDDVENDASQKIKTKESKSSFEVRQERLKSKISELEAVAINEKPWQLKGEISATSRPQNSLLEEVVEFDLTTRPAPVITEETTLKLEDLILQRIKDRAWDDVERKVKPVDTPQEYKKKLVLNQEKSKQSLAQIYEQEYLKQKEVLDPNQEDKPEEEPEAHREIRVMLNSLFAKLDALSNFHYTPKPAMPEIKVVSNIPAITMEEVAPVGTSTATLLAPEEVKAKPKGDVLGKDERTDTDKKRERRHKKMMQRDRQKEKERREKEVERIRPGLGNKYSKEKAVKMLEKVTKDKNVSRMKEVSGGKAMRSSTAFFNQLQEEVTSHIKSKTQGSKKRKIETISAKRMKL